MKNENENVVETFKRLDQIASGKLAPNEGSAHNLKQQIAAAEERGRNFQPAYIKSINEQTARGRQMIDAAKRGENVFPPARMVTGKPHKP
jgi:hypothetical protein